MITTFEGFDLFVIKDKNLKYTGESSVVMESNVKLASLNLRPGSILSQVLASYNANNLEVNAQKIYS